MFTHMLTHTQEKVHGDIKEREKERESVCTLSECDLIAVVFLQVETSPQGQKKDNLFQSDPFSTCLSRIYTSLEPHPPLLTHFFFNIVTTKQHYYTNHIISVLVHKDVAKVPSENINTADTAFL